MALGVPGVASSSQHLGLQPGLSSLGVSVWGFFGLLKDKKRPPIHGHPSARTNRGEGAQSHCLGHVQMVTVPRLEGGAGPSYLLPRRCTGRESDISRSQHELKRQGRRKGVSFVNFPTQQCPENVHWAGIPEHERLPSGSLAVCFLTAVSITGLQCCELPLSSA